MTNQITGRLSGLLILLILSSCSVIKNVKKDQQKANTETELELETKSKEETKTDSEANTVITEKVDTTITEPGTQPSIIIGAGLHNLAGLYKNGFNSSITIDNEIYHVDISFDSAGVINSVTHYAKERKIPVMINRRTEIKEKSTQVKKENTEQKATQDTKTETKIKTSDRDVKKFSLPWWIWLILALIVIGYVVYKYYRRFLPF